MRNGLLAAVAVTVLSCGVGLVRATPVPVGGSATFGPSNGQDTFVPPTGDLLDSETRTLDLTYSPNPGETFAPGRDTSTSVQLDQEVRRDPGTGQLSFLYKLTPLNQANEGEEGALATYTSFGSFATDVTGEPNAGRLIVSRSADGSSLLANGDSMGLGRPPIFAVATDATNFDKNGSLTLELTDEFQIAEPGTTTTHTGSGTAMATFDNIFEPAAEGPPPPPPTGIPLPPGVWGGLVLLGCCGGCAKIRQLRTV